MNQSTGVSSLPTFSRVGCFLTAFTTGAVVMALEILGSRLLAPVFGNSLFVWGALIGVVLAAMSSGYAAGGWLADRRPAHLVLACLLLGAGVWTLLLARFGQPVVFTVSDWIQDPRWGPCLAAGIMLAVPAFGLSGVLPALLRLAIADMGHLGRHTGAIIAVSTIGSLMGTWGTSFYLLTWLGSLTLVAVLGIIQMGLGIIWLSWAKKRMNFSTIVPIIGLLGVFGWLGWHPILVQPPGVYEEESPYQQVRVRDDDLFRYLILDNTFHAVMWKAAPVYLALPYSQMMMATLGLQENPERALILGHGGGSLAKWLAQHWPHLEVDVVEMDPSVVHVADEFFEYEPGHHRVFIQDARRFLQGNSAQYDIIWVDVFARHLIPFHLTTQEFFAELRKHLDPDGILSVNLASSDADLDRVRAEAVLATMKTSFPHVESFSVKGPEWLSTKPGSANVIFFAGQNPPDMNDSEFTERVQQMIAKGTLPPELMTLLGNSEPPHWKPGLVLTDDFSPFDILQGSG